MGKFMFSAEEIAVMKNFATINQSMAIKNSEFYIRNSAGNTVGIYKFKQPYDFNWFGIYEIPEFLSILGAYKNPQIEVSDKYLTISESSSKVKYMTTVIELLNSYYQSIKGKITDPYDESTGRYRIETNFDRVTPEIDFIFSQEKLTMLMKMAGLLKSKFIFVESVEDKIRLTVGDELEASQNTWEVEIDAEDIKANSLNGKIMKLNVAELRILNSDYEVKISVAGISKWTSSLGIDYFIGCSAL